jgi:hypothetical protein
MCERCRKLLGAQSICVDNRLRCMRFSHYTHYLVPAKLGYPGGTRTLFIIRKRPPVWEECSMFS